METKTKKISSRLIIPLIIFSFFFPFNRALAWDAIQGAIYRTALDNLSKTLNGITIAAAKRAAVEIILSEIDKFVDDMAGVSGGVITNWEDFLKKYPEEKSKKFMNDYLSGITEGKSSSRYRSVSVSKTLSYYQEKYEGFGGRNEFEFALIQSARAGEDSSSNSSSSGVSYGDLLEKMAENITGNEDESPKLTCTDDMRENMFSEGNLDNFWECTEGINYAPLAYAHLQSKYEEDLGEEKVWATVEAQSTGIVGKKTSDGQVTAPAASIEATITKAETLSMDILAKAETLPEIAAASVITAIDRSIKQGIGALKAAAQRQVSNVRKSVTKQIKSEAKKVGPKALFGNY
ncbi:MAG: hypothetical protein ACOYS2_01525 [Patescibacteria group bacterium]